MVTRKRLRTILNALALYALAALLIGYFGVNAYSGDRGLKAKEDIDRQMATLTADLDRLKLEHAQWERRIALLKSDDHRSRHARRTRPRAARLCRPQRPDDDVRAGADQAAPGRRTAPLTDP